MAAPISEQERRGKYEVANEQLAKTYLFADRQQLGNVPEQIQAARELIDEPGLPDLVEGNMVHDQANLELEGFAAALGKLAKQQNKPETELTREEVAKAWQDFPKREYIEDAEEKALASYERSASKNWSSPRRVDSQMAHFFALDIKYRQALRMQDETERTKLLTSINDEVARERGLLSESGHRAEYELIYIARRMASEQKLDHLFHIEHSLPREDYKAPNNYDLRIFVPSQIIRLSFKALDIGHSYKKEYHDKAIEDAKARTKGTGVVLLVVDTRTLGYAFNNRSLPSFRLHGKNIMSDVHQQATEQLNRDITILALPKVVVKKKESPLQIERKRERQLEREIASKVDFSTLERFGLLTRAQRADVSNVPMMQILRKKFVEVVRPRISKVEELNQPTPELIEKIKQAMGA
jgi:hypothetical protein